jgi:hypothetical protein
MSQDPASMNTDAAGQQLHDRATRGEALSTAERAQLDAWYARFDAEEGAAHLVLLTEELRLLEQYREALAALEHLQSQHPLLLEEQRALLEEQHAMLKLLLPRDQ